MLRAGIGRAVATANRLSAVRRRLEAATLYQTASRRQTVGASPLWIRQSSSNAAAQEVPLTNEKQSVIEKEESIEAIAVETVVVQSKEVEHDLLDGIGEEDLVALGLADSAQKESDTTARKPSKRVTEKELPSVVDGIFKGKDAVGAYKQYREMEENNATAHWGTKDYERLLRRLADSPLRTSEMFDTIYDNLKKKGIAMDANIYWHLLRVYVDADIKLAEKYQKAEARLKELETVAPSDRNKNAALRLGTELRNARSTHFIEKVESLMTEALDSSVDLNPQCFNIVLRMYSTRRDISSVTRWIKRLQDSKKKLLPGTYITIISAFGQVEDLYSAQKWFEKYLQENGPKQEVVFTAFIEAIGKAGASVGIAKDVLQRVMKEHKVPPTIRSYNALLSVLAGNADFTGAKKLIEQLRTDANFPKPDELTYSIVFEKAVGKEDWEIATEMYELMSQEPAAHKWDYIHLGSYGQRCLESDRLDEAVKVFRCMYSQQKYGAVRFTEALLDALLSSNRKPEAFELLELVDQNMSLRDRTKTIKSPQTDRNIEPFIIKLVEACKDDVKSLITLQRLARKYRFYRLGGPRVPLLKAYEEQREKSKLTVEEYHTLYDALFSRDPRNSQQARAFAFLILEDLKQRQLKPTKEMSDLVLDGFNRYGLLAAEIEWKRAMQPLGVPTPAIAAEHSGFLTAEDQRKMHARIADLCKESKLNDAIQIVKDLEKNKLFPSGPAAHALILACGRAGDIQTAMQFFAGALQWARGARKLQNKQFMENTACEAMLIAYVRAGLFSAAANLITETPGSIGRNPWSERSYDIFFDSFLRRKPQAKAQYDHVWTVFNHYKQHNMGARSRAAEVYRKALEIMRDAGRTEDVRQILSWMREQKMPLNPKMYHNLIFSLARTGGIQGAQELFDEYVEQQWENMDIAVFNAMIMGHIGAKDLDGALRVLKIAKGAKLQLDVQTFELLATGYARHGKDPNDALQLLKVMQERGLDVRDDVCQAVIEGLCVGENKNLDGAMELVDGILRQKNKVPVGIVESLVEGLAGEGQMDLALKYKSIMADKRIGTTTRIEEAFLKGYLAQNDFVRARQIFDGLVEPPESRSRGRAVRTEESYKAMIDGALKAGRRDLAAEYLGMLEGSKWASEEVKQLAGELREKMM